MRYPSITLGAGIGLNTMDKGSLFDPIGSGFALLNGALFQPIFQNGKLKANYKIAGAEREIAELNFKDNVILGRAGGLGCLGHYRETSEGNSG